MEILNDKKLSFLQDMANRLRQDTIEMVSRAGSGHVGGPLGMAEIISTFYFHILNHKPKKPNWPDRDRFVLSNGHACPILYAALARSGYFSIEELKTLRMLNSRLQGHPHRGALPGIETTSGPLGSGISQSIGMALAAKLDGNPSTHSAHSASSGQANSWQAGSGHGKYRVYCMTSDGEHEEGNTWEGVMFAGKNKLSNMTVIVDRNNIQIDGFTENVMPLEPFREKYEAFNWHVIEIDGHNIQHIADAVAEAKAIYEKPTAIIAHTIPGKGVGFMENDYLWHSKPFRPGEAEAAIKELRTLGGKIQSEHQ